MSDSELDILVVDDARFSAAVVNRTLATAGYTRIRHAHSAQDALGQLTEQPADLVVADWLMPGMDGPTWVRRALQDRPDTRVVFVSGYAEDIFGGDKEQIPNSTFLPKPFSLNDLTETVHQQIA